MLSSYKKVKQSNPLKKEEKQMALFLKLRFNITLILGKEKGDNMKINDSTYAFWTCNAVVEYSQD